MRRRHSRGQALAEFAIALPVLLLLILGLFDVGRLVFVYNGLTNAAREGARLAIVNQDRTMIAARTQEMAFGTTVTTTPLMLVNFFQAQPNSDNVEANAPCDNSDFTHQIAVGCIVVVKADTIWQPITPVIGNILGPITLHARSELAIEFVCPNAAFPAYATSDLCPKQP